MTSAPRRRATVLLALAAAVAIVTHLAPAAVTPAAAAAGMTSTAAVPRASGADAEVPAAHVEASGADAEAVAEGVAMRLVREARARAGVAPLRPADPVADVARARAVDMRDRGYFAHESPDGTDAFDLLDRAGIGWSAASEAIGWNNVPDPSGSAERVVADWLASPDHRSLLLASDRDTLGLASAMDPASGRRIWVLILIAIPVPVPPPVAVRALRVGRPDGAGMRALTLGWSPRGVPTAAPIATVTIQVRPAGGRWSTAIPATTRRTVRVRVRAPGAFDVRVRGRTTAGVAGPWSVLRVRP